MKKFRNALLFVCMVLVSVLIIKMDIITAQAADKKEFIIQIGKTKIYNTSEDIVEGENWKYDKTTNTLTISNLDLSNGSIFSDKKLKIKASGQNKIKKIGGNDAILINGDKNASMANCDINPSGDLYVKNMTLTDCFIPYADVFYLTDSFLYDSKCHAMSCIIDNSTVEFQKDDDKNISVIYANAAPGEDGLVIKNSIINIDTAALAAVQLYGGKCSIFDSTLNITAKATGLYLSGSEEVTIKNCEMKLQTTLGTGTLGCPLNVDSSDSFQILNSKIALVGKQCAMGTYNTTTVIKNSDLDITAKTDMGVWIEHGDDRVYTFTVDNSNINITAAKEGIFSVGVKIILKSGKMNVTSKKKSGIMMRADSYVPEIHPSLSIKGGTCNINGNKYGIEFITESKLSLTGGTLTLNGGKAAVNMTSKLPIGKTYAIKAGSAKNKAKSTASYGKTDKYISIKKK